MNWYKTSKLADKSDELESNIYSACMYCKRWATHEGETRPDPNQYVWKKTPELNEDEKAHAYAAEYEMANQDARDFDIGISHGICPYCDEILEEIGGWPESREQINYVTQKSLEKT